MGEANVEIDRLDVEFNWCQDEIRQGTWIGLIVHRETQPKFSQRSHCNNIIRDMTDRIAALESYFSAQSEDKKKTINSDPRR